MPDTPRWPRSRCWSGLCSPGCAHRARCMTQRDTPRAASRSPGPTPREPGLKGLRGPQPATGRPRSTASDGHAAVHLARGPHSARPAQSRGRAWPPRLGPWVKSSDRGQARPHVWTVVSGALGPQEVGTLQRLPHPTRGHTRPPRPCGRGCVPRADPWAGRGQPARTHTKPTQSRCPAGSLGTGRTAEPGVGHTLTPVHLLVPAATS